ncbi:MAG: 2-oxo acid dehydrogenase subunit E2 [Clostridia bacterium]|nr:2-oxo acid dehydrogenase subunit E2 [Clostridia bacterium]
MSSYYITKKSFSLWASLVCALLAMVAGVQYFTMLYSLGSNGIVKMTGAAGVPVSALIFALAVLFLGKRKFSVTTLPVVAGSLSLMLLSGGILPGSAIVICGLIYILMMMNVIKSGVLLVYALGISVIFHLCGLVGEYLADGQMAIKTFIFFAGVATLYFAALGMRRDYGGFTIKWNDRAKGRRIRTMDPMSQLTAYFMPDRIGAQNLIRDSLELSKVEEYIAKKRKEGLKGFGFMHVFIAAYLRVVAEYPRVNRFLSGQKVYSRYNCEISLAVKKEMSIESPDTTVKMKFVPGITAEEVYAKVAEIISENKGESTESTFDLVAKAFSMIPGVVLKFTVWFIKLLDYFGLLPTALEDVSPFHGSMFFTSMASLGIPVIHHHLYDFGNVPVFCAFGKKYKVNEAQPEGSVVEKRYMDYSFSVDERICDGYYFAQVLKSFKKILSNPECLDNQVEPKEDIL